MPRFGFGTIFIALLFISVFVAPTTELSALVLAAGMVLTAIYLWQRERSRIASEQRADKIRRRGIRHFKNRQYDQAIVAFDELVMKTTRRADHFSWRGLSHQMLGHWSSALVDFEKARDLSPADPLMLVQLANLLAACPDSRMRNGDRAVTLATEACEVSDWQDWRTLNALAVAYAEVGRFNEAVTFARKLLNLVPLDLLKERQQTLFEFENQRIFRLRVAVPRGNSC